MEDVERRQSSWFWNFGRCEVGFFGMRIWQSMACVMEEKMGQSFSRTAVSGRDKIGNLVVSWLVDGERSFQV